MKKKIMAVLVAAGMVVSLAACGGSSQTATGTAESAAETVESAAETAESTAAEATESVAEAAASEDAELVTVTEGNRGCRRYR